MTIVHCDVRALNCTVEARVNQIPVMRLAAKYARFQSRPVAEFVIHGNNLLEVVLNPGSTPSRALDATGAGSVPDGARMEVRLVEYQEGEFPGQGGGRELARVEFNAGPGGPSPQARLFSGHSEFINASYSWAWQSAAVLQLDPDTLSGLAPLIRTIHNAFLNRDPAPVLDLARLYYQEYALAYPGQTAGQAMQTVVESIRPDGGTWVVAPLVPHRIDLRLCAGGRLVDCVDLDWNPLIRADIGEDIPFEFPILAGFYQGRWQVLR